MPHDTRLKDLFARQENAIKAFEYHRQQMKKAVSHTEQQLLQQHGCTISNAPPDVLAIITKLWNDYEQYWSTDGILFAELMRRQAASRQKILDDMQS